MHQHLWLPVMWKLWQRSAQQQFVLLGSWVWWSRRWWTGNLINRLIEYNDFSNIEPSDLSLLIPKTIGNRKRDCAWGCAWGINTTWVNLQIEKHKSVRWAERTPSWFVLFDLQVYSGGVYSPSATSRTISFSISNSLIHFFDFFDEKEERCSRKFDRLLCCFDPLSITPFDSAKNANRFEKCNVFGNGKCGGRNWGANVLAKKSAKLVANTKVHIFGKEKCKTHRKF